MWDKIKDFIDYKVFTPPYISFHRIKEKVCGTIAYAFFIWKSNCYRDWDWEYLYMLIEFKLKRMEKLIRTEGVCMDREEKANEIQEALDILKMYNDFDRFGAYITDVDSYIKFEEKKEEFWRKFHNILRDKAKRWWD